MLAVKEDFIQFVWLFQYFNKEKLEGTSGEYIEVIKPGTVNTKDGPDFLNAHIRIDGVDWYGHVEIHSSSGLWNAHEHSGNPRYENVVLHVVWEHDLDILRGDGSKISTLELQYRIPVSLLEKQTKIFNSTSTIPCKSFFDDVDPIHFKAMINRTLYERLNQKANSILEIYDACKGDWEEASYRVLLKNLGFKSNSEAFYSLSKVLPLRLLRLHNDNPLQLEALLFGQAGFLEDIIDDDYFNLLKHEYVFLSKKYAVFDSRLSVLEWRFKGVRLFNLPHIRLAQAAVVLCKLPHLFSYFLEVSSSKELVKMLSFSLPNYWKVHYSFSNKRKVEHSGTLGHDSIDNIIINTVAPLLYSYGLQINNESFCEKAIDLLSGCKAEKNSIVGKFNQLGFKCSFASESQGVIELYNSYCSKKRCFSCSVCTSWLKSPS